jgi:hypothetical protein
MLLLAALAFLSLMGLLPLWGTVLTRALTPSQSIPPSRTPTLPAAPTPTQDLTAIDTPSVATVTAEPDVVVPNLVGAELERARQLAGEVRLGLAIEAQRHDLEVPASYIIAQSPLAETMVPPGTDVAVTVSLGPEMVTVPEVVGFPIAVKRLSLEDIGLVVAVTETWSIEPAGLVVSQTPEAGTIVTVGHTITLAVSSGAEGEVRANLGDKVVLVSCEFTDVTFQPGDAMQLLITWEVQSRFTEDYTVFIHVIDDDRRILTQRDLAPLGGGRPTTTWQPGERLLDPYVLTIPSNAAEKEYWVEIGLYRGDQRLPVVDPGLAEEKENAVVVRQIRVQR